MATIKEFQDLDAWQKSHELRVKTIKLLATFPQIYQYGLCQQLQRSSISVSSNIAEGFGRNSVKEKLHFFSIAEGSLTEVHDQIILCKDLELLTAKVADELLLLVVNTHKLIHGLMRYIRNTNSQIQDTK